MNILFEIETIIGKINTTAGYWELITNKHPEVKELLSVVNSTLKLPEQIRRSKTDKDVYLFYKQYDKYQMAVVVKKTHESGFIVTAYLTNKIKEGDKIWPR